MQWHIKQNVKIVLVAVVSASADTLIRPFCQRHGFLCISTRLDYSDGKFTGRFARLNCQGAEKKNRVLQQFPGMPFRQVIAFGNSPGDEAMMELATEKIWVK